ncbi:uncharacterized protein LAJ45_08792 [Morchella importuna]|uniref:uncharacterized protein n=1 Tax=Morchella importuna TaxID=1174673 RepID=UPI001E8CF8F8|nr:uncharacterized protein LAJ45_08792 [Morchella importuna]KAH8147314.1 hypothetical protein LAJ45_08792 [Morchella importuna]
MSECTTTPVGAGPARAPQKKNFFATFKGVLSILDPRKLYKGRRVSPNAGAQVQEKAESIQREGELAGEDGAKGDSSVSAPEGTVIPPVKPKDATPPAALLHYLAILHGFRKPQVTDAPQIPSTLYKTLDDSERTELLKWVTPVPYEQHHRSAAHARTDGTGAWLFESTVFREWRDSNSSTLIRLHGMPGSGKRTLTSLLIDVLLLDRQTHPGIEGFAYFYCDPRDKACWDPDMVLRALLVQLCTNLDATAVYGAVCRAWKKGYLPTRSLLVDLLGVYPQNTIVIYNPSSALFEILEEVVLATKGTVKVFVAVEEGVEGWEQSDKKSPVMALEMANEGDIDTLLDVSVKNMKNLGVAGESEEVGQLIRSTLRAKANGCFLWVDLQLKMLSQLSSSALVQEYLRSQNLPTDLESLYEYILSEHIHTQPVTEKDLAHRVTQWLLCAPHALSPEELVEATNAADINTVLRVCHNLVIEDHETGVVRFAHRSIPDFLGRKGGEIPQAHEMAAERCLHCLTAEPDVTAAVAAAIGAPPAPDSEKIKEQLLRFFGTIERPSPQFVFWLTDPHNAVTPSLTSTPLSVLPAACHYGFLELLDLTKPFDANTRTAADSLSLLSLAAGSGHTETVRTLISHGGMVNQAGSKYGYALHYAAAQGQADGVQVLLQNGADPHRIGWNSEAALVAAVRGGHESTVKVLLQREAGRNVNAAFVAAAGNERKRILEALIEAGPDVGAGTATMWAAIEAAVSGGVPENLALLIELLKTRRGFEGIAMDEFGSHAARAAVRAGSVEMLQTVFDMLPAADLDLHSPVSGKTALQLALEAGSAPLSDFLIGRGARVTRLRNLLIKQLHWARDEAWFPSLLWFLGTRSSLDEPVLTPQDVRDVQTLLLKLTGLPEKVVSRILHLGEYWVYTEASGEEKWAVQQHHPQQPYVQVPIESSLEAPVRRITFCMRSHDQGWADDRSLWGTYHGSHTWFEAGPVGEQGADGRKDVQRNLAATWEAKTHMVTWDANDPGAESCWLRTLKAGQVLGVYPRAQYPGWVNHVERVDVRVYCAWA